MSFSIYSTSWGFFRPWWSGSSTISEVPGREKDAGRAVLGRVICLRRLRLNVWRHHGVLHGMSVLLVLLFSKRFFQLHFFGELQELHLVSNIWSNQCSPVSLNRLWDSGWFRYTPPNLDVCLKIPQEWIKSNDCWVNRRRCKVGSKN